MASNPELGARTSSGARFKQLGGGHIRELGRYSIRAMVKGFGLADTARINADPLITLLSQLSK
jgi:hypothetical protein